MGLTGSASRLQRVGDVLGVPAAFFFVGVGQAGLLLAARMAERGMKVPTGSEIAGVWRPLVASNARLIYIP
jgi:hypothetical protein